MNADNFKDKIMGLGMLVDGKWVTKRQQEDEKGSFIRPATTFRNHAIPETDVIIYMFS